MEATKTQAGATGQQPRKPRFFNPQPVHLDYMHALDNLRASRSPSVGASSAYSGRASGSNSGSASAHASGPSSSATKPHYSSSMATKQSFSSSSKVGGGEPRDGQGRAGKKLREPPKKKRKTSLQSKQSPSGPAIKQKDRQLASTLLPLSTENAAIAPTPTMPTTQQLPVTGLQHHATSSTCPSTELSATSLSDHSQHSLNASHMPTWANLNMSYQPLMPSWQPDLSSLHPESPDLPSKGGTKSSPDIDLERQWTAWYRRYNNGQQFQLTSKQATVDSHSQQQDRQNLKLNSTINPPGDDAQVPPSWTSDQQVHTTQHPLHQDSIDSNFKQSYRSIPAARGRSPHRANAQVDSRDSMLSDCTDNYLSHPTVPHHTDFNIATSIPFAMRATSDTPAQHSQQISAEHQTAIDNRHRDPTHSACPYSGPCDIDPNNPQHLSLEEHCQIHDHVCFHTASHHDDSVCNVTPCPDNCEMACDVTCDSDDCDSCDGSDTCCAPCTNPEMCASGDCDDPTCFDDPQTICTAHHSSTAESLTLHKTIEGMNEQYVNPRQLMLNCHWETSGQQCEVSLPNVNSLSEHVLQNHIHPQTVLPCEWNSCSDQVDVDEISQHVWHNHSPSPRADSYVCLWKDCGEEYSTSEALDDHMKTFHCRISCHWDGCEQATTSETALRAHVDNQHITRVLSLESGTSTPSIASPHTPVDSPRGREKICKGHNASVSNRQTESRNAGEKTCQWIVEHTSQIICGEVHSNGNDLQSHIEAAHLATLAPSSHASSPQQLYACRWRDCKYRAQFPERSKLARHIYTHTAYMIGSCRHCGKEFNNQNQLSDHERTHTQERPFTCPTCGFRATNKPALATHLRTHTGEKPLKCDKCDYTCGDPSNMSKHRKIHDKPLHACHLCDKAFCRMATLKRHLISHQTGRLKGRSL